MYRCSDRRCPRHNQSLVDWELGALHRKLSEKGDDESAIHAKIIEFRIRPASRVHRPYSRWR